MLACGAEGSQTVLFWVFGWTEHFQEIMKINISLTPSIFTAFIRLDNDRLTTIRARNLKEVGFPPANETVSLEQHMA